MKKELIERFGDHRVSDVPTLAGKTPLLVLDLELKTPITVIVTNGLRNYNMPVPEKLKGLEHTEIYFCLPSYWEWEDTENPLFNWIFEWIDKLSKFVVESNSWFGHGHTMPCGKERKSLSATMLQNHLLLAKPLLLEDELTPIQVDGKEINFLSIIPIFPDEMDYKQGKGTYKFLKKLTGHGVTEKLDDYRSTVLRSKWRFKRRL